MRHAKGTVDLSKVLITGIGSSCVCLGELQLLLPCPLPSSYWYRAVLLDLQKHNVTACKITEIKKVCAGEKKQESNFRLKLWFQNKLLILLTAWGLWWKGWKYPARKIGWGKKIWNKLNRMKFRIYCHQRVFINLLEKGEGATIQINNKFFFYNCSALII